MSGQAKSRIPLNQAQMPLESIIRVKMDIHGHHFVLTTDNHKKYEKMWFDSIIDVLKIPVGIK